MMLIPAIALLVAEPATPEFPEQVPGLMEACLADAILKDNVTETDDSHKYICSGDTAARFWNFLELAKVHASEQDTAEEGRWLSRYFPLGGCFKQIRLSNGKAGGGGLSCTIWVPRPVAGAAERS